MFQEMMPLNQGGGGAQAPQALTTAYTNAAYDFNYWDDLFAGQLNTVDKDIGYAATSYSRTIGNMKAEINGGHSIKVTALNDYYLYYITNASGGDSASTGRIVNAGQNGSKTAYPAYQSMWLYFVSQDPNLVTPST